MSSLEYFRFEVIPERSALGLGVADPMIYGYGPSYRIEIGYGGKRHNMAGWMPPPEFGLTESWLEHLIRSATRALKSAIDDEADKKAKAHLDRKRDEFVNAVDAYKSGRVK